MPVTEFLGFSSPVGPSCQILSSYGGRTGRGAFGGGFQGTKTCSLPSGHIIRGGARPGLLTRSEARLCVLAQCPRGEEALFSVLPGADGTILLSAPWAEPAVTLAPRLPPGPPSSTG